MFSTLIASGTTQTSEARGAVPSVLLHVGVIVAMIVATQAADPFIEAPRTSRVVPLLASSPAPPQPSAPPRPQAPPTAPAPPEAPTVPMEVPTVPVDVPTGVPEAPPAPQTNSGTGDPNATVSTETGTPTGLTSGNAAFEADGVDVAVRLRSNSPLPRYPDVLRLSGVAGLVRVRFVVGADGRAEMNTVEILERTHPAFEQSVRNVLPRLRFTPARVGPRAVRQIVELPFGFEMR